MTRTLTLAVLLAVSAPVHGAAPASAPGAAPQAASGAGMVSLSLVDALTAIEMPQIMGLFAFIAEQDAPFAFADLSARDPKVLKKYLGKLKSDKKVAGGLTAWDHGVCATLVNLYSSPISSTLKRPDAKQLSAINECVLAPVVTLAEVVERRKA